MDRCVVKCNWWSTQSRHFSKNQAVSFSLFLRQVNAAELLGNFFCSSSLLFVHHLIFWNIFMMNTFLKTFPSKKKQWAFSWPACQNRITFNRSTFKSPKPLFNLSITYRFIALYFMNYSDGFRTRMVKVLTKFDAGSLFDAFGHREMRHTQDLTTAYRCWLNSCCVVPFGTYEVLL